VHAYYLQPAVPPRPGRGARHLPTRAGPSGGLGNAFPEYCRCACVCIHAKLLYWDVLGVLACGQCCPPAHGLNLRRHVCAALHLLAAQPCCLARAPFLLRELEAALALGVGIEGCTPVAL